jgi:hypothetical protein
VLGKHREQKTKAHRRPVTVPGSKAAPKTRQAIHVESPQLKARDRILKAQVAAIDESFIGVLFRN